LIIKEENKFIFKVSFLKRTKLLKYYLNLALDGADTIMNIYNHFVDAYSSFYNYNDYFKKLTKKQAFNPVVLIFDNEIETEKPLKKFLAHAFPKPREINEKKDIIKKNCKLNIIDNLYLLTINLVDDMKECEIEDLFFKDIHERFSFNKDNPDKNKFSKNILKNYKNI
ncbi:hypothetical protein, partial [Fusobacterium polymorphum]